MHLNLIYYFKALSFSDFKINAWNFIVKMTTSVELDEMPSEGSKPSISDNFACNNLVQKKNFMLELR